LFDSEVHLAAGGIPSMFLPAITKAKKYFISNKDMAAPHEAQVNQGRRTF